MPITRSTAATASSSNGSGGDSSTSALVNSNVIVAKQIIKCPKFNDLKATSVRDQLVKYDRYLRENGVDPATVSAARLQNNCSEGVLRTIRRLELKPNDHEFTHEELETYLRQLATNAVGSQHGYAKWAITNKIRLKFTGREREHVEAQYRDLQYELQDLELEAQRNPLDLQTEMGRLELSRLFSFLLPRKYRTRYQEKLKAIPGAGGQLTQYEHPVLVTVINTFKEVLTQLAVDLSELNYEPQKEIDPRKPIQIDPRPAQAKKKKPRASSKKPKWADSPPQDQATVSCEICRIKGHSTESCWFNKKNKGKRPRDFAQRGKPKRKRPRQGKFASMVATLQESVNEQNKHTAELNSILQQLMKSQVIKAKEQNAPANGQKKD